MSFQSTSITKAFLVLLFALGSSLLPCGFSFAPARIPFRLDAYSITRLAAKKKRRRRKQPPGETAQATNPVAPPSIQPNEDISSSDEEPEELTKDDLDDIANVAKFAFTPPNEESFTATESDQTVPQTPEGVIPLPDIREARQKKMMEEELAREEEEKEMNKVKVKRSDKEAFTKLLEQSPYSDADDSLFEEEEYGTVSALLGERAEKFLGIPTGPLQVGHFVGALGIMLMAFIEYPGFPLTNLPTPLRDCLQGGLATVYAINTVLAALAFFQAGPRGQPRLLWVAKTFSVGGLAYDQLMQLPTTEEIEKAKSRKGARSLENLRKKR